MAGPVLEVTSLVCGALNGWASIMIEATLTSLSVTWFPVRWALIGQLYSYAASHWFLVSERTTATGVVIAVQMSGLIPPALIFPRQEEATLCSKLPIMPIFQSIHYIVNIPLLLRIVKEPPANVTSCEDASVSELRMEIARDVSRILYTEARQIFCRFG